MSQPALRRTRSLLIVLVCVSCGVQFADPIVEVSSTENTDACSQWTTETDCVADAVHGCSFQPNTVGCLSSDTSCGLGLCRGGDPYVSKRSQTLWLHGAPYRFIGAVSWGTAGTEGTCRYGTTDGFDATLNQTFDELMTMRANVLRFWAFQSFAGATGVDFTRMDRVVAAARRAGIRLIPVLENGWADCTEGGTKSDAWFASGYQSPYGVYSLSYRDYVQAIVTHYRDEPTILAWELMHEAQATDHAALLAFVKDMSQVVRTNAPFHLISIGLDGGSSDATSTVGSPSNYERLQAVDTVDLVDVHDFDQPNAPLPASFSTVFEVAANLKKPVFIGACAVKLSATTPAAYDTRANDIARKIEATQAAGSVGFLVYEYNPNWTELKWSFDGRAQEPLAGPDGVIANHAAGNP